MRLLESLFYMYPVQSNFLLFQDVGSVVISAVRYGRIATCEMRALLDYSFARLEWCTVVI
jgi:hypothetical protein